MLNVHEWLNKDTSQDKHEAMTRIAWLCGTDAELLGWHAWNINMLWSLVVV